MTNDTRGWKIFGIALLALYAGIFALAQHLNRWDSYNLVIEYMHLAVVPSGLDENYDNLDGVEFPHYIGYLMYLRDSHPRVGDEDLTITFVKATPYTLEDDLDWIIKGLEKRGYLGKNIYEVLALAHHKFYAPYEWDLLDEDPGEPVSPYYPLEYNLFRNYLYYIFSHLGANIICTQLSESMPVLYQAQDFEFENICVYRPFDNPPEFCNKLEVKLKNDPLGRRSNATAE